MSGHDPTRPAPPTHPIDPEPPDGARPSGEGWDLSDLPDAVARFSPAEAARLIRADQRRRWKDGQRVPVEAYLGVRPDLGADPSRLLDLVYAEYLLAEELGAAPSPAAYTGRFPAVAGTLAQQLDLHRLLAVTPSGGATADTAGPASPAGPGAGMPGEHAGGVIAGKYELVEAIGEGGMGTVWSADQTRPVRRRVAVKLIKAGMDSARVVARFEVERQALALMAHPHIAKVFDAGTTDGGRPYFVMELVPGVPLTEYCDRHRLSIPARLALFDQVCSAVQHAHQKGVIHRDLKPGNILVEGQDGRPVPKVIDFGLAKALGGLALTESTLFTVPGTVAGTPLYMAPEQAAYNPTDVDTRADVYSLGVILYELLTGSTPIRRDTLNNVGFDEVLRVIREQDPPTPSSRLGTSAALSDIAANRHTDPARLARLMRGDLDWVVMKALEKDRSRRYDTAAGLARDVRRYLADEVVEARPPSAGYRLNKFVRRNRGRVLAGSLVLLALVVGVAGTVAGLVREAAQRRTAEGQRDRAVAAEDLATRRLDDATREKQRADEEADVAREVSAFLQNDILLLADTRNQADRRHAADPDLTLRAALDRAADRIGDRFRGKPATEAAVRRAIGEAYVGLGLSDRAVPHLEQAVRMLRDARGPVHADTLAATNGLGVAYLEVGKVAEATRLFEENLRLAREARGPAGHDTLIAMGNVASAFRAAGRMDEAVAAYRQTVEAAQAVLGPDHEDTLVFTCNLGRALCGAGDPAAAVPLLEGAVARQRKLLVPGHPDLVAGLFALGTAYRLSGDAGRAVTTLEDAAGPGFKNLGPSDRHTESILHELGTAHLAAGNPKAAVPVFERLAAVTGARRGKSDRAALESRVNLAQAISRSGDPGRAADVSAEVVETATRAFGRTDPLTLVALNNRADALRAAGRLAEAIPLFEEAVRLSTAGPGAADPATLQFMHNLAVTYRAAGQPDRARAVFRTRLAAIRTALPAGGLPLAAELVRAGSDLQTVAGHADSEPVLREGVAILREHEPDGWRLCHALSLLGAGLFGQGRYTAAEPLLTGGYDGMLAREKAIPSRDRRRLTEAVDRLVEYYTARGDPAAAARWQVERQWYPPEQAPPPRPVRQRKPGPPRRAAPTSAL